MKGGCNTAPTQHVYASDRAGCCTQHACKSLRGCSISYPRGSWSNSHTWCSWHKAMAGKVTNTLVDALITPKSRGIYHRVYLQQWLSTCYMPFSKVISDGNHALEDTQLCTLIIVTLLSHVTVIIILYIFYFSIFLLFF